MPLKQELCCLQFKLAQTKDVEIYDNQLQVSQDLLVHEATEVWKVLWDCQDQQVNLALGDLKVRVAILEAQAELVQQGSQAVLANLDLQVA